MGFKTEFRVRALEILRISGLRVRPLGMLGVWGEGFRDFTDFAFEG